MSGFTMAQPNVTGPTVQFSPSPRVRGLSDGRVGSFSMVQHWKQTYLYFFLTLLELPQSRVQPTVEMDSCTPGRPVALSRSPRLGVEETRSAFSCTPAYPCRSFAEQVQTRKHERKMIQGSRKRVMLEKQQGIQSCDGRSAKFVRLQRLYTSIDHSQGLVNPLAPSIDALGTHVYKVFLVVDAE